MAKIAWAEQELPVQTIVGIDEANFSPSLAGDCVVAAVWLPAGRYIAGVGDSKALSLQERLDAFAIIQQEAVYSVHSATPSDIAWWGIWDARDLAAKAAVGALVAKLEVVPFGRPRLPVDLVISDTSLKHVAPALGIPGKAMVRAGHKSHLVACASIVAKTYVDALFKGYDLFWPGYGLGSNHGSVGPAHREALRRKGPSPAHRGGKYAKEWWQQILGPEPEASDV